jgi:hypothetical protein
VGDRSQRRRNSSTCSVPPANFPLEALRRSRTVVRSTQCTTVVRSTQCTTVVRDAPDSRRLYRRRGVRLALPRLPSYPPRRRRIRGRDRRRHRGPAPHNEGDTGPKWAGLARWAAVNHDKVRRVVGVIKVADALLALGLTPGPASRAGSTPAADKATSRHFSARRGRRTDWKLPGPADLYVARPH